MRRFWKSTEYYLTAALVALILYSGVDPLHVYIACGVLDSYIIGRTLWKKNRGLFHSGALTSEMQAVIAAHVIALLLLPDPLRLFVMAGNQAIYNLARGLAKSIGVKNHFI